MIQLTDYKTGEPIYVDPKIIASLRQLPSHVTEIGEDYFEHGRRTVISVLEYGTVNFYCLVKEEAEYIRSLMYQHQQKNNSDD